MADNNTTVLKNNLEVTGTIALDGSTSGTTTIKAPAVAGSAIITLPSVTGTLALSSGTAPVAVGASLALTTASAGGTFLLNTAAGSTLTLPAASGSGAVYRAIVTTTTTSNAHKILPASVADFLQGKAVGSTSAGATLQFHGNAAASHSIQMPFAGTQPSGGLAGDVFEFRDIAAGLWEVIGNYQSGTTATTPFSTATT